MNNKIKILFLIDAIETDKAGTEGQIIKLINNMNKEDFECHLGLFKNSEWINNNRDIFNIFLIGTASLRKYYFYIGIGRLYIYLRKNKIDIVNVFFPTSITIGVLISKLAGVKYIFSSRRDMGFWRNKYIKCILQISNKYVTKFLVNSYVVKNDLITSENIDKNKIEVIYNGLENINKAENNIKKEIRAKLKLQESNIVVGTVANLNREVKRIDVFIECAKHIIDIDPMVKFIIIGDGHLKSKYSQLAKNLKVNNNVIFIGSVSNPQDYASIFDIAINSSDSEGFSNAVLEYLALGIPTIATDVGGNSEIICHQKNGILVPPGKPQIMANAVMEIIRNRNLRDSISLNAKKSSKKYSLSLMVARYENIYRSIMEH